MLVAKDDYSWHRGVSVVISIRRYELQSRSTLSTYGTYLRRVIGSWLFRLTEPPVPKFCHILPRYTYPEADYAFGPIAIYM